jgi:two-component system response regulator HydG
MVSLESKILKLVAIDDDQLTLDRIRDGLDAKHLQICTETNPERGLRLVKEERPEIAVVDRRMPGHGGMELVEQIVEWDPAINVIVLTDSYSPETAVGAIKRGAVDYITKSDFLERLSSVVKQIAEETTNEERRLRAMDEFVRHFEFHGVVGCSPSMQAVFDRVRRIAPHFRITLVTGETGTGKQMVAKALHSLSPVSAGRFVRVNTPAMVESLLENELFGHIRGGNTGAVRDKKGLFEHANGGTLFLEEIGEMSRGAQTRLLRVLQTQEIQGVGSPEVRKLDVRVIAATHRDLEAMVRAKTFREDLYDQLSIAEMRLPSLAERKEDLPLLERFFVKRFAQQFGKPRLRGLTQRTQLLFRNYAWPGNLRELENVLIYACMVAEGDLIDIHDLPERMRSLRSRDLFEGRDLVPLQVLEERYAYHVVQSLGGNRSRAASALGISRTKLYRLLRAYDKKRKAARESVSNRSDSRRQHVLS